MDDPVTILGYRIVHNHNLNQELKESRRQKADALHTVQQQSGHVVFGAEEISDVAIGMQWRTGVESGTHDRFREILLTALPELEAANRDIRTALPKLEAANDNIRTEIYANYDVITALQRQAHNIRRWVISAEEFADMNEQKQVRVKASGALVLHSAFPEGDGDDAFGANQSKRKRPHPGE
tara:strand:+ start:21 stop:563 length:543 start_codon:yes stop_codon:yes gene_type:complete